MLHELEDNVEKEIASLKVTVESKDAELGQVRVLGMFRLPLVNLQQPEQRHVFPTNCRRPMIMFYFVKLLQGCQCNILDANVDKQ